MPLIPFSAVRDRADGCIMRRHHLFIARGQIMTTFHFHLRSGDQLTLDEEGEDFADYASALSEVNLAARDLVVQAIRSGKHRVPDAFVIADGSGKELGTLSFETILPVPFSREPL